MTADHIRDIVERLAEDLLFWDRHDRAGLQQLAAGLATLGEQLDAHSAGIVCGWAQQCHRFAEQLCGRGRSVQESDIDLLGHGLSALQAVLCLARDPQEIVFPAELDTPVIAPQTGRVAPAQSRAEDSRETVPLEQTPMPVLPAHVDQEIFAEFLSAQSEVLEQFEGLVLEIEQGSTDAVGQLKRLLHTLKGESGMLGLKEVQQACHELESTLARRPAQSLVDGLLAVRDWLRQAFAAYAGQAPLPCAVESVLRQLEAPTQTREQVGSGPAPREEQAPPEASTPVVEPATTAAFQQGRPTAMQLPAHVSADLLAEFLGEQAEVLRRMEALILALEGPERDVSLREFKRLLHTLKGESGMLGLRDVQHVCHQAEQRLESTEPGLLGDWLLRMKDWLEQTFRACAGQAEFPIACEALLAAAPGDQDGAAGSRILPDEPATGVDSERVGELFRQADEHLLSLELDPHDVDVGRGLLALLKELVELADLAGRHDASQLVNAAAQLLALRLETDVVLTQEDLDLMAQARDVAKADCSAATPGAPDINRRKALERLAQATTGIAELPADREITLLTAVETPAYDRAPAGQQQSPPVADSEGGRAERNGEPARPTAGTVQVREPIRVDAGRLDNLVDMLGELVIAESMVSQSPELAGRLSQQLTRQLRQLDKITRELQELGMSLRMVSMRATFQKMARLVRDLSHRTGKAVDFSVSGADTELDKTVVDQLNDPLVHLIRNAVDHGIENDPQARRRAGKPERGQLHLRAYRKGGSIYIEVRDDGPGLDREAIIARARERGLLPAHADRISDREVFALIFAPGFSTARTVTDISGRGVGMDVVRKSVSNLRGVVDIESAPGQGTIFRIRLPLTLAVIDGMVVRLGAERYILPTVSIIRSLQPQSQELTTMLRELEMLTLEGESIPLFRLDRLFAVDVQDQPGRGGVVVIVEDEGRQAGIIVDELLGRQQVVIKPLGVAMEGMPCISGGAILPDGLVGLIVDVPGMVRLAWQETGAGNGRGRANAGAPARAHCGEER